MVLDGWLDSVILEVFSGLNDSVITMMITFHLREELHQSPSKRAGAGFIKTCPSPHLQTEL